MRLDTYLHDSAQRHPDRLALVCGERRASYGELETAANALAHALRGLGLARQQRVAIQLDNSVEAVQALFGTLKAAGVFVLVNPQVKGDKLAFVLKDCGVRVLVTDARHYAAAAPELSACPELEHVILAGDATAAQPAGCELHHLAELPQGQPPTSPPNPSISLDLAALIYTSGTTGQPKGVMLSHANMRAATQSITHYLGNTADDVILSSLPLAFGYGLSQVLTAFSVGARVVLEKQFLYPYRYIELIKNERVTGLPIVSTITALLLGLTELDTNDFESVRYVTSAAQPLPERHIRRLRELMPGARIFSMYGQTECARVSYLPPELIDAKPASVGIAIPDTEAWIEDEAGRVVTTPHTPGELVVRGPHVMLGYWNRPEDTA